MNTLRIIWRWIRAIIVALWTRGQIIAGATATAIATGATATGAAIAAFIYAELIILGVSVGLCLIGFIFNLTVMIWIAASLSALTVFVFWLSADTAIRLISDIAAKIPVVGRVVNVTADELKKLLPPFLLLSLALAFIATVSAIRGPGYYTWTDLMVLSSLVLFIGILSFYLELKVTKATGWAMLGYIIFLLAGNYLWSTQVQGALTWIERKTIKRTLIATDASRMDELVSIPNNTSLYKFGFGKFSVVSTTTETNTVVKVIGRQNDPRTKEPMYEVILPVAENLYVGGKIAYVPARLTKLVQKTSPDTTTQTTGEMMFEPVGPGHYIYNMEPGQKTNWKKINSRLYRWELHCTTDGEWDLIPFVGEIVYYKRGVSKYADLPKELDIFQVHSKEKLTFVLDVFPAKSI